MSSTPPPAATIVIFGGSGDLARRKLVPALFELHCQGQLAPETAIVGFARSVDSDAAWLRHTDLDSAPVALLIYQNSHPVDVRAGDCVAVRYDGGKIVRIYPAPLAGTNGTFYVASDGSTYLDPELTRPAGAAPADRGHQE